MMVVLPAPRLAFAISLSAFGCTVDAPDKSIGELTAGPVTATAPSTASAGDDGSGSGDDGGSGSGDDGGDDGGSTGGADDGTASSGSGGGPGTEQPLNGMYSECTAVNECVGLSMCITAGAADGFCTDACSNPGTDCDPSPGGTAPPICAMVTGPVGPTSACALDCSLGQVCPGGMMCAMVESNQLCV